MSNWVVILAGGIGSRFWPLSTPERPKQLLALVTSQPLLLDTVERVRPLADPAHMLVLTNALLEEAIADLLPEIPRANIVAEPTPRGTAAALGWAAHLIQRLEGDDAVMISVHADWAVRDSDAFRASLVQAARAAQRHHALVTVAVVPSRPDPGLGYIQPADEVEPGVHRVGRFVEKPDRRRAEEMLKTGHLWNSGIFVWRVVDFLQELHAHTPEIAPALDANPNDIEAFFASVQPISVDVGVLERSHRVMVVSGDFGWDDVGTWGALARVRSLDDSDNALSGQVHAIQAHHNVVHAEDDQVVLYGVDGLVVVVRKGVVLVTTLERSGDLKTLIDSLPRELQESPGERKGEHA